MQLVNLNLGGSQDAQFIDLVLFARSHQPHFVLAANGAIHHSKVDDHAPIAVVVAIKNQRPQGLVDGVGRGRHQVDNRLENFVNADPFLGRGQNGTAAIEADNLFNLFSDAFRFGSGQIDFVEHRDNFQVVFEGEVDVGQGLGLNPLGGIDHQQRSFAGDQRSRHLVGKINVAGGVDQVENVVFAVLGLVVHAGGLELDGNAPLPLQIHAVEELGLHLAIADSARAL